MSLLVIDHTKPEDIIAELNRLQTSAIHATNGTYVAGPDIVVPTTLAGFQFIFDNAVSKSGANAGDSILIAINSDKSMEALRAQKEAIGETLDDWLPQKQRAANVAIPIATHFAENGTDVTVAFYDEETPTALYEALAQNGAFEMKSLFKWGYGTNPDAPRIEGAQFFNNTYGFPLPFDQKPLCHDITAVEDQSDVVRVHRLTKEIGSHGAPFITEGNKVLFPVAPKLRQFSTHQTSGYKPKL